MPNTSIVRFHSTIIVKNLLVQINIMLDISEGNSIRNSLKYSSGVKEIPVWWILTKASGVR